MRITGPRVNFCGQTTPWLRRIGVFVVSMMAFSCGLPDKAEAAEAQWIWAAQHDPHHVPHVACHFRKTFNVRAPEQGQVSVYVDDSYELFVNGRRVAAGRAEDHLHDHNITRFLSNGRNVIALKVVNTQGSTAGVAARVMIREHAAGWRTFSTDDTWRTNLRPLPFWNTLIYNDSRWSAAATLGRLGDSSDTSDEGQVTESRSGDRFQVADDFAVEPLIDGEQSGSLIAIAFNEFGHLIASREGGPLLLIYDDENDGKIDTVREYCKAVKNCQGILALNGDVYVTAEGPEGAGLYLLRDKDHDGHLEDVDLLIHFGDEMGEHGAHGLALGPDGLIYIVAGNHLGGNLTINPSSPHRDYYEGDLVTPRYEDPSGHAAGKQAPGGVVLRTDLDGAAIEAFAGGFRNPYDLAFNREGELFVHDGDMESDLGTTWYRPTRLFHVIPGAEFGWRSGWAKWPDYFFDSLPGILDTGRGSPTGAVSYNHFAFPTKYHDSLFLGDWSGGKILSVKPKRQGGSYSATAEVFVQGTPLNVTDLAIGPDGALYFSTGGRGTEGGLYRVSWQGRVPDDIKDLGDGMSKAIRYPQLNSAASRQQIARLQNALGADWERQLIGVVRSSANPWYYRTRALELMQLFGPPPSTELIAQLAEDKNEIVRAKAAQLMGTDPSDETREPLRKMLADPNPVVRRRACEALLASGEAAPLETLTPLLVSKDRSLAWSARRLLERLPSEEWREKVLQTDQHRLFIQGGLALMIAEPAKENGLAVLDRFQTLLDEFISDTDFVDMLRLAQVVLHRCEITPDEIPELCDTLGEEFPSTNHLMNRELVRLLIYLQVDEPMERYMAFLKSDAPEIERVHLAMHLRFLAAGWSDENRFQLIRFLEAARQREEATGYAEYISNLQTDLGKSLPLEEGLQILARASEWPNAALGVLYRMPNTLDAQTVERIKAIDRQLRGRTDHETNRLRVGLLAVMARSGDPESLKYLKYSWDTEPDRREAAVLGLAQDADRNWDYLIRSLPILEGESAREIVRRLQAVDAAPDEPEPYRQLILIGLRLKEPGVEDVLALLTHWTGHEVEQALPWEQQIEIWQDWFVSEYPEEPSATLPVASELSKWNFEELYSHLTGEEGASGSRTRGAVVFEKAQCSKCHRYGNRGEPLGPDLTSLSRRFMKKEVLQSILFPSHIIPDQYRSKSVITTGGRTYTGMLASGPSGGVIVLDSQGTKHAIRDSEIDEVVAHRQSVMPERLLDPLTLVEISDLFAYLGVLPAESVADRRERTLSR